MTTKLLLHYAIDGAFFVGLVYGLVLAREIRDRLNNIKISIAIVQESDFDDEPLN